MIHCTAVAAEPGQPEYLFKSVDQCLGQVVGHKLFTLMILHAGTGEAERVYTNNPIAYPISGRKQMTDTPWYRQVVAGRQHYLGPTREDIRWAFPDYALIEELGCGSVINILVMYDGDVLGTANLLHEEGYYAQEDIVACIPFAQLLAPAYQVLTDVRSPSGTS